MDSLGRQPPPRAKPGNHWHRLLAHGCRISGPKFVQEFKLSTASPGYKKIAPRQAFGSQTSQTDAAQLQKQAPTPGTEPLDHLRAHRRNDRRRRRRAQLLGRPRDPLRAAKPGRAVRERPLQRPHGRSRAMRSVKAVITGRLWVGETRLFATNSPHSGKAVRRGPEADVVEGFRFFTTTPVALRPTK